MPVPGQSNVSQMARLLLGAPSFAVGWQEPVYIPDPAAGATWKHTVDGRYFERIVSVRWGYLASAEVVNRYPLLTWRDANGTIVLRTPAMEVIVAGNNLSMNSTVDGYSDFGRNQGEQFGGLPDLMIPAGWSLAGDVVGIDAGDQVSGVVLLVQRFPNDAAEISAVG